MRIAATTALLVGAASAAVRVPQDGTQHVLSGAEFVLGGVEEAIEQMKQPIKSVEDFFKGMTSEAKATWDELKLLVPNAEDTLRKATTMLKPKPHTRRPDSHWDHIVKGADLQSMWTTGEDGQKHREIDGQLEGYKLRAKAVDPSKLGLDNVKQYSGYLDDEANDKHLFYWFFESRNDPKNDPVVLWLNGGPGCSSLTGLLFELGPGSINKKIEIVHNDFSWSNNASVIFLDQPVNVGFSYSGSSVSSTVAAGKDVYALMTLFFHQFPEYAMQDFHIAGESYAGHYIPVFASEILSHDKRNINLKSVMIGNGLTDGLTQYAYYRPMACGEGGWDAVLDEQECRSMDNSLSRCQSMISNCYDSGSVWSCVPASIYCNNAMIGPYQRTGRNVYDIRGPCKDSSNLCYPELGWISDFLNRKEVMEALGAEVSNYESCNMNINRDFLLNGDWMQPFHRLVPKLLEKIPVLIYAGTADYICNWLGNQAWTEALEWKGKKDFNRAEIKSLTLASTSGKSDAYGKVKSSGNFTFMSIFEAGHMVPYDQPEPSLDFVNRWLSGEWFAA